MTGLGLAGLGLAGLGLAGSGRNSRGIRNSRWMTSSVASGGCVLQSRLERLTVIRIVSAASEVGAAFVCVDGT